VATDPDESTHQRGSTQPRNSVSIGKIVQVAQFQRPRALATAKTEAFPRRPLFTPTNSFCERESNRVIILRCVASSGAIAHTG